MFLMFEVLDLPPVMFAGIYLKPTETNKDQTQYGHIPILLDWRDKYFIQKMKPSTQ